MTIPNAYYSDYAWDVSFIYGGASSVSLKGSGSRVRLVRAGQCFGPFALGVSSTGTGQITSSAYQGISCETVAGATGYFAGDQVTLTASPAANLISWGGACASAGLAATCTVTMDAAKTVTLTNTGTAVLNISNISASGDFAVSNKCGAGIGAGGSCTLGVTFKPTASGTRTGSVVITSDASNSPNTITLTGTGLAVPVLTATPASLSFGATALGSTSAAQTLQLSNTGGAALTLASISASGDFAVTNNCGSYDLGAAGFCNLSVTFTPTATGNRTGAVTITSNAPGSPHTLALSGSTPGSAATVIDLFKGWNLLGNGQDQPLTVAALFGVAQNVTTVWKWDVKTPGWQFYAPSMDAAALQTYATSKGYGVLTTLHPSEGFWVNAIQPFSVTLPSGTAITGNDFAAGKTYALRPNWNLVATGTALTPSDFNTSLSATPPAVGLIPINLTTLWAWDNPQSKWYFYSPSLDGKGGTTLFDYTAGKSYLDFAATGKLLGAGMGFWVNKP